MVTCTSTEFSCTGKPSVDRERVSSTHIGKSYVTPKRSRPSDCYSASLNIYQAEQTEHGIFQFSCGQRLVLLSYLFGYDSAMYRGGGSVLCKHVCLTNRFSPAGVLPLFIMSDYLLDLLLSALRKAKCMGAREIASTFCLSAGREECRRHAKPKTRAGQ